MDASDGELAFEITVCSTFIAKRGPAPGTLQYLINRASAAEDEAGRIVTLTKDYEENVGVPVVGNITLDLNGHTITVIDGAEPSTALTVDGTLTLIDSRGGGGIRGSRALSNTRGIMVVGTLVMEGGTVSGFTVAGSGGGVFVVRNARFIMNGGTISGNTAEDNGGGVFAVMTAGTVLGPRAVISGNHAANGGGIAYCYAGSSSIGGAQISGNSASNNGGGVYCTESVTLELRDALLSGNTAEDNGGGIYCAAGSTLTIDGTSITDNRSVLNGGGLWTGAKSSVTMDGSSVTDNEAGVYTAELMREGHGGGLYLDSTSTLSVRGSEIRGNTAYPYGGGAYLGGSSTMELEDCTIVGNSVNRTAAGASSGGGFYLGANTGATLNDVEMAGNHATAGGGLFSVSGNSSSVTVNGGRFHDNFLDWETGTSAGAVIYMSAGGSLVVSAGEFYSNGSERTTTAGGAVYSAGAGIFVRGTMDGGTPSVVFRDNKAGSGAAIQNGGNNANHTIELENVDITNNTGSGTSGAVCYSTGKVLIHDNAVFRGNRANGGSSAGGAVYGGTVTVDGAARFESNYAVSGGAIYGSRVNLLGDGAVYEDNSAENGGAIHVPRRGAFTMSGGTIRNNTASSYGGGIYLLSCIAAVEEGGSSISGGTICGNTALAGGGIYASNQPDSGTRARLTISGGSILENECTGSGDDSIYSGGGVYIGVGCELIMTGGEIRNNKSNQSGGGIFAGSASHLSWTKQDAYGLDVQGGVIMDNTARTTGNDIAGWTFGAGLEEQKRIKLTLCKATEMGEDGQFPEAVWYDEIKHEECAGAVNGDERFTEYQEAGNTAAFYYGYTFRYDLKAVAQIGSVNYFSLQAAFDAIGNGSATGSDVVLLSDTKECVILPEGIRATLNLKGFSVIGREKTVTTTDGEGNESSAVCGSVLVIPYGSSLTLRDTSDDQSGAITEGTGTPVKHGSATHRFGGGVLVGGEFVLESGNITNNKGDRGSGVFVNKGASFVMKGGSVSDNAEIGVCVRYATETEPDTAGVGPAVFRMESGEIRGNKNHGIYALGKSGEEPTLEIAGGEIFENSTTGSGGVFLTAAELTLSGGKIRDNSATSGGGVYAENSVLTLSGGEIRGNRSTTGNGGGVSAKNTALTLSDTAITGNSAPKGNGGGLYLASGSFTMTGGEISGSLANHGAALYLNAVTGCEMTGGEIRENRAVYNGGGVYASGASCRLAGVTITDNVAGNCGGGVYSKSASLSFTDGEITGNRAVSRGGGIYFHEGAVGPTLRVDGGARLHGNEAGIASDLYTIANAKIEELIPAANMGTGHAVWYDEETKIAYTGSAEDMAALLGTQSGGCYQNAEEHFLRAGLNLNPEAAARIERDGLTHFYGSVFEAITDSRDGETVVVLKDVAESFTVPENRKDLTLNLNGYTITGMADATIVVGSGAQLKLVDEIETDGKQGGEGTLLPSPYESSARGVYLSGVNNVSRETRFELAGGTIKGFTNSGIYGESRAAVVISGGTIRDCSTSGNGGGVYLSNPSAFTMSGGTIRDCSAVSVDNNSGSGGGIYAYLSGADYPFVITGGEICGCSAEVNGGGIDIDHANWGTFLADISGVHIHHNHAQSTGGGVFVRANSGTGGSTAIHGLTVEYNSAGSSAGGVYLGTNGVNRVGSPDAKTEIRYNRCDATVGGIAIGSCSEPILVENTDIHHNMATGTVGISLVVAKATVRDVGIYDNTAYDNGLTNNGVAGNLGTSYSTMELEFDNVYIARNKTERGGGSAFYMGAYLNIPKFSFTNCTFEEHGGSLLASSNIYSSTMTFTGCSFLNNKAPVFSNIYFNGSDVTFTDCEIGNNSYLINASYANGSTIDLNNTHIYGCTSTPVLFGSSDGSLNVLNVNDGTVFENNDGAIAGSGDVNIHSGARLINNASSGNGGAINKSGGTLNIEDGVEISGNSAKGSGGAVHLSGNASLNMPGGTITDNSAANGGAISLSGSAAASIGGGEIRGNSATNGGALYLGAGTETTVTGGFITDNRAVRLGGGVYVTDSGAAFTLSGDGKLYDNRAGFGQEAYFYWTAKTANPSRADLIKATEMFRAPDVREGISWWDEGLELHYENGFHFNFKREYGLMLLYKDPDRIVAKIDLDGTTYEFATVQSAMDFVRAYQLEEGKEDDRLTVRLVADDIHESVTVPGGVTATLDLNGHTLTGVTNALTVLGDLELEGILDPADPEAGDGPGTITGSSRGNGGGILIQGSGRVVMKSGEIAGCEAAPVTGGKGGGVCVEGGSFELQGGSIHDNSSSYGGGVYVGPAGSFLMSGGEIRDNSVVGNTNYYNRVYGAGGGVCDDGGIAYISGGRITGNSASDYGGGVYLSSGGKTRFSFAGTSDDPVVLSGNTSANQGGGLYQAGGTASIEHVRINDNKAGLTVKETVTTADIGNAGGGLCLANGKTMIFGGVDVTRNEAARGGGIAICGNSTVTMVGGSVISNKAQLAGGIYQNPLSASSFSFNGGKLYANRSIRTSTGNDFYSFYEGADDYPGNRQKDMPIANLQSASRMGNENYNIWRDDRYDGANLSETYGEGRYISSAIPRSRNDLLTASSFTQDELPVARSDMKVSILAIKKIGGEETEKNAHLTGAAPFDTTAADKEVFARDLLGSGAAETDQTYLFNGREEHYISYNGKLYEQEQAVEWSPGDDASQYNTIVRTYDKVTYMLYIGAESVDNTPGAGSNTTVDQDGRKVYYYQIRGVLPCDESEAEFSLDTAASTNLKSWSVITQYVDGKPVQVLNATYEAKIGAEDQAFENTKNIYVTVRHMKNGDTFKPTFTAWIEGNEDNTDHPAACASKMLTVSAAGRYNLTLLSNNALSYTGYFDLETGQEAAQNEYYKPGQDHVVHGTMLGYGVTVEMYNNDPAKGIKGLELPTDELEFDLRMRGGLYLNGEPITDSSGEQMTKAPYIWAYKENSFADTGRPLGAASIAVNMNWDDEDELAFPSRSANNAAPLNKSGGVAAGANSAYSGGNWLLLGNQPAAGDGETVMHIRLKGYAFDKMENANPTLSDNGTNGLPWSPGHVKAFSAGYIQVIFPFEKKDAQNQSGYLSIDMQAVVSDLEIERISGQEVYSTAEGILHDPAETPDPTQLERYFGAEAPAHATNEMLYSDNFVANSTGMYVSNGDGDATGDGIGAVNYYANAADAIMELETGKAATPLATERIYVGSRLIFSSKEYRTDDPENFPNQYIPDDVFDPAIHNKLEYNYLTALNLLQKYDPTAFHLSPTDKTRAVVGERFNLRTGRNEVNGFIISNSETETQWSNPRNSPYNATQSYTLTILYAAKPDGTAWNKQTYTEGDLAGKDDGGTADMRSYCEENLVYYTTLAELEADGKECVAILYELRDCCIRRQRSIRLDAPLTVTDDFSYTGNTYATTHEVRGWTTYRPEYKSAFPNNKDSLHLYSFDWADHPEMRLARGNTYIDLSVFGYDTTKVDNPAYYEAYYDNSVFPEMRTRFNYGNYEFPQYYKTQYRNGSQIGGTHNGSASGNSILLYTLTTSIRITNEDYETNEYSGVRATHYDVHHTRTASFKVWPAVDAASEVLRTGELKDEVNQYTNLTVTVTIPKGLTYEEGSFGMDFSDSGYEESDFWKMGTPVVHSDGTTTIVFNAFVRDVSLPLPQITYRTKIGDEWDVDKDVKNGDVLTSTASIYATYEEENVLAATIKTDRVAIHIVKNDGDAIYLGVEKTLTEINEQIGFTLNYQNYTREKLENIQLLDVLPYNGDGRGTEFHGGYRVEEIVMQFNDDASYEAYKNGGGKLRVLGGQHADALRHAVRQRGGGRKRAGAALRRRDAQRGLHGARPDRSRQRQLRALDPGRPPGDQLRHGRAHLRAHERARRQRADRKRGGPDAHGRRPVRRRLPLPRRQRGIDPQLAAAAGEHRAARRQRHRLAGYGPRRHDHQRGRRQTAARHHGPGSGEKRSRRVRPGPRPARQRARHDDERQRLLQLYQSRPGRDLYPLQRRGTQLSRRIEPS